MSNEIISVINALCDKLGIAVDWTSENVMPQVQYLVDRYARYLLVDKIVWTSVWLLLFLAFAMLTVLLTKWAISETDGNDRFDAAAPVVVVLCILAIVALIVCLFFVSDLIRAATIPEIYAAQQLLEMIGSL